ncbi:MAG: hypothetical protein KatS3mg129_1289 [Leptospiraceae bacterium]|nr:MAG: hypothetical protein KatS3mg129_1289 [Leptospiraceae bacterium]
MLVFRYLKNYINIFSKLNLINLSIILIFLTGCFDIFHYIKINDNNSLDIKYRILVSSNLMEMGKETTEKENKKMDFMELRNTFENIKSLPYIQNFHFKEIDNSIHKGFLVSFRINDIKNIISSDIEKENHIYNIIPMIDKNQIIFFFPNNQNKKEEINNTKDNKFENLENIEKTGNQNQTEENSNNNQQKIIEEENTNKQMEKIVKAILSSATYSIILKGKDIIKARLINISTNQDVNLNIEKLDHKEYMIDFPFTLFLDEGEKGYKIIIDYL